MGDAPGNRGIAPVAEIPQPGKISRGQGDCIGGEIHRMVQTDIVVVRELNRDRGVDMNRDRHHRTRAVFQVFPGLQGYVKSRFIAFKGMARVLHA